jgi:hypothetical protein
LGAYANAHITVQFKEIDMAIPAFRFAVATTVLLLATMFTSSFAFAQVSDGRDKPSAVTGLGESAPDASDLSSDPAWKIFQFERDGIRYLQVNDTANSARAAIGQIGATAWVLPIGRDADRVSIQANTQSPVTGRILYRDDEIEVVHYRQSNQDRWIIRPTASSR